MWEFLRKYWVEGTLVVFLTLLSFVDDRAVAALKGHPWLQASLVTIQDWKLIIALLLAAPLALIAGLNKTILPENRVRTIRQNIMATMMKDDVLFPEGDVEVRITIFQEAGSFRCWRIYVREVLSYLWYRLRFGVDKEGFPQKGVYVVIAQRDGKVHPRSKTYFYVDLDDPKKTQGIAGRVWHYEQEIRVSDLPDITGVDLAKARSGRGPKPLKEYMKKGHVSSIRTLSRLNRRSRHFYGDVLYNSTGKPVGVIVIDSVEKCAFLTAPGAEERMKSYVKTIGLTL